MATYDRYSEFRINGTINKVPNLRLSEKSTDYFEEYRRGVTRLDLLSYKYYGNANYDWLIMMANPEYGSLEFQIPDGAVLRIPYPLDETIKDYSGKISTYETLYGID